MTYDDTWCYYIVPPVSYTHLDVYKRQVLVILLINTLLKGPRHPRDEYDEEEPDEDFFDEDLDQEPEEDFFDEDIDEESDEYYFDEEPDEEPQKGYPKAPKNEPQEKPVKKKYESDIEIIDLNDL